MSNFNIVIYHGNCNDGFGSASIVYKFLKETYGEEYVKGVEFHAAKYGSDPPSVNGKNVIIVDFTYDEEVMDFINKESNKLFIIDHHKTSYERLKNIDKENYSVSMDNAGVVLTWKHFYKEKKIPLFLKYIEDRDLWWNNLRSCKEVFLSTSVLEKDFETWKEYIEDNSKVDDLINIGKILLTKENDNLNQLLRSSYEKNFKVNDKVYNVGYINSKLYRSDLGHMIMKKHNNIDFAACYYYEGKYNTTVLSLRSLDFDVSKIAKLFGGGGHKCAAGLSIKGFHNCLPNLEVNLENLI